MVRISLRQEAIEVPPQDVITRDNVTLKVNAVIFLRVIDPNKAVVEVSNYAYQTSQFAQTTLRSVLGEQELDELLAHRDKINLRLQSILDTHTAPWGVKVANVEVKQVDMPESMLRAMAKQAEAEREKRSKIIHAEGEFSAAQRLVDAAHCCPPSRPASSCAICRRSPKSASRKIRPSCSPCPSTSSPVCRICSRARSRRQKARGQRQFTCPRRSRIRKSRLARAACWPFFRICAGVRFLLCIGFSLGRKTTTAVNGLSMSPSAGTPASAVRPSRQKTTRTALPRQRRSPAILVFTRPWREKRRRRAYAARGEDSNGKRSGSGGGQDAKGRHRNRAGNSCRRKLLRAGGCGYPEGRCRRAR